MRVAASAGKQHASTESMLAKPKSGKLDVPYTTLDSHVEAIALGFKMELLSLSDEKGKVGSMDSGAGLGTDFLQMTWGRGKQQKMAFVRGIDLLCAWLDIIDPKAAAKIRKDVNT